MSYQLNFDQLTNYDPGQPGITLPVTLKLVAHSVAVEAKLDTGATDCIFARKQAEQLGISVESGRPVRIRTATGSFIAHAHDVTLNVLGLDFDVPALFAKDSDFNPNVLGRHGFLDHVYLGLVDYEGKLYLSRYGDE
jgi:hypothetical protein